MTTLNVTTSLQQFAGLHTALADACSLIIMRKSGFLYLLAEQLALQTIPEVVAETGLDRLPVSIRQHNLPAGLPTDAKLLQTARQLKLPLISEDKKILLAIQKTPLPCFNALMLLNFLLWKKTITPAEHTHFFRQLQDVSRYSRQVYRFSREVFLRIVNPPAAIHRLPEVR